MEDKKFFIPQKALIPLGVVLAAGTFLLSRDWIHIPDQVRGVLMGAGCAMIIVGALKYLRRPKPGA